MKCLAASKSTKAALHQAKILLHPKKRCFISSNSSSETVTAPPVRHLFSMCPGTCRALDLSLDLHFPQQIHQCPGHLGHYHNSQTSESTRGKDLHEVSNMRKAPYRRISSRLQLRRCFSWLLPFTNCSQGGTQAPLPTQKTQPVIFKRRFLDFTCHPLSLLCELPLCISFAWVSIQNRSKSLNFSAQFLTPLFFLPSPF